jgi:hypothetical protein
MKKKLIIMMSAMLLMMAGTVMMACSNDDDVTSPEVPETGQGTRQLPKQADFVKTVTEIGYITCDTDDDTWIIDVPLPVEPGEVLIDGGTFYYLYDLPKEYQKKGLKVKATLDAYIYRHFGEKEEITTYIGWDYYDAVLKQIEIAE